MWLTYIPQRRNPYTRQTPGTTALARSQASRPDRRADASFLMAAAVLSLLSGLACVKFEGLMDMPISANEPDFGMGEGGLFGSADVKHSGNEKAMDEN